MTGRSTSFVKATSLAVRSVFVRTPRAFPGHVPRRTGRRSILPPVRPAGELRTRRTLGVRHRYPRRVDPAPLPSRTERGCPGRVALRGDRTLRKPRRGRVPHAPFLLPGTASGPTLRERCPSPYERRLPRQPRPARRGLCRRTPSRLPLPPLHGPPRNRRILHEPDSAAESTSPNAVQFDGLHSLAAVNGEAYESPPVLGCEQLVRQLTLSIQDLLAE
jgi:hypothetical protein